MHFCHPYGVVVLPDSGDLVVSCHHALRVVTPGGAVPTLAGSEKGVWGFADGQGAAARSKGPRGLALDADGSVLVADAGNHAVRPLLSTRSQSPGGCFAIDTPREIAIDTPRERERGEGCIQQGRNGQEEDACRNTQSARASVRVGTLNQPISHAATGAAGKSPIPGGR